MNIKENLIHKLKNKQALIGIIGLGYVGLPLALRYCEVGYSVLGFDVDPNKADAVNKGQSYIKHIDNTPLQKAVSSGQLTATTDMKRASEADALILCVPTPLTKNQQPDLSFIINSLEAVMPYLREGQVISLESTTYPGTTDEILKPRIEQNSTLKIGDNFFLAYSPEREDPGNKKFTLATTPKVCSGYTPSCLEVTIALYESVAKEVVPVSSPRTAEMSKLLENIHRAINIGLINELKIIADKMGIDIYEVIHAAATKPFGFVPYYPGPGLGGHCIPIDPFYLTWKSKEYGIHTRFIELAGEINTHMPEWVVNKTALALNERGKAVKNSKILILGITYKKNIDDMRESPAVNIMELLMERGANIAYSDPYFPTFPKMREHDLDLQGVQLTPKTLSAYDCVVITTAHDTFDYQMISQHAPLIIDTRGVYKSLNGNIIRA